MGLQDGRLPAAQHRSHPQGEAPVEWPAVFHDAMLNAGFPKVAHEWRRGPAAPMEHHDQPIDSRTLQRTRQSGQLAPRTGYLVAGNQRRNAFREGA